MVGTPPATVPTVAQLQHHLMGNTQGWLTTYPHLTVSFTALAELVHQLLTVHLTAARAINDELAREIAVMEAELADARAESEHRESEIIALTVERDRLEAQLATLDTPDGGWSR